MGWTNTASSVLTANTVIVVANAPNTGIFLYSGTPTTGNLVASITAAAGTDPYGNAYTSGFTAYRGLGFVTDVTMRRGAILFGNASTNFTNSAILTQDLITGGNLTFSTGTGSTPQLDSIRMQLLAGLTGVSTGNANVPAVSMLDGAVSSAVDLQLSGSVVNTGIAGTPTLWQTPSYNAGWAGGDVAGTFRPMQFRFDAMNNLYLSGAFHTTSATPSTFAFVLPAAYRPTTNQRAAAISVNGATVTAGYFQVGLNGNTGFFTLPTAANVDVYFSGIFPLGNLP